MNLSAFNRKTNRFFWQVKEHSAPIDGLPCFTKSEMANFDSMTSGEILWCLAARIEDGFMEIAFPRDWSALREQGEVIDPTIAQVKCAEILASLKKVSPVKK